MPGPLFVEAVAYAVEAHDGQLRKGTATPYVSHLLAVASIALEHGADEEEAVAALLHDVVEDQGGLPRLRDVERSFGARVARIVDGCSDTYEAVKTDWRARKEGYLARLAHEDASVLLVSAADKLHNARSLVEDLREHGPGVWRRFRGGREGSLWYYRALLDAYRAAEGRGTEGFRRLVRTYAAVLAALEEAAARA